MNSFKIRPLGEISDFVREHLPFLLSADVNVLHARVVSLASTFNPTETLTALKEKAYQHLIDIALLDLKMINAAIIHSGLLVPVSFREGVTEFSAYCHQPEILTYEELIFVNPGFDMRIFSAAEAGSSERLFYSVHGAIEQRLLVVLEKLDNLLAEPTNPGFISDFKTINNDLIYVEQMTTFLKESLNTEHFLAFRKFLSSYPNTTLKGPSGAFSGAIAEIHFKYGFDPADKTYVEYVSSNFELFPRKNRPALKDFLDGNRMSLLKQIAEKRYDHLVEDTRVLGDFLLGFRKMHYGLVARHLSEAVKDKVVSTSGEQSPGEFLRDRIRNSPPGTNS